MDYKMQEQVAERAYSLWQAEGCPEGRDLDHWLAAEHELLTMRPAKRLNGARKAPAAAPKKAPTKRVPAASAAKPAGPAKPRARKAATTPTQA